MKKHLLTSFVVCLTLAACATPAPTAVPPTKVPPTVMAAPPTNTPIPQTNPTATSVTTSPIPNLLVSDLTPKQGKGTAPQGASGSGPWATRLMLAASKDGLTFTRTNVVISDQAGVPNALVDKEGRARIYYIDFGNNNIIATAIQKSATEWVLRKVIVNGLPKGSDPVDPTVALLADGKYRLYYMQGEIGKKPTIYSAISNDGITFTKEDGERYNPSDVYDPIVLQTKDGWLLWTGPDGKHSAKSKDGLKFEATGEFKIDGKIFMTWATVAIPDKGYRVYGNLMGPGSTPGIASAFSTDGVKWTLDPGTRLPLQGADPKLEKNAPPDHGMALLKDGTYLMAYLAEIP